MSWLLEDVRPLLLAGLLLEGLLVLFFVRTGRLVTFVPIVILLALMGAAVLVEYLVVTDKEQIAATLDQVALALKQNDAQRLMQFIDPQARDMRRRVDSAIGLVVIREAEYRDLSVTSQPGSPPTATAEFIGRVAFTDPKQQAPFNHYMRRFRVHFRKVDDQWIMTDYEVSDVLGKQPFTRTPY
ncbi:MAG: hypothetical protein K6T86_05770 [Pirellulales bacterium]|nr:hypothetical protein [Pirellulales bacterium]